MERNQAKNEKEVWHFCRFSPFSARQKVNREFPIGSFVGNNIKKVLYRCLLRPLPRSSPPMLPLLAEVPPRDWECARCGLVGGTKIGVISHDKGWAI